MAGNVPFSKFKNEPEVKSPSCSFEELSTISNKEYVGDMLTNSKTLNTISEYSSEDSCYHQLQEQYRFTVEHCLTELKRIERNNEEMLIQVKRNIRDKIDQMSNRVKHSFECMHTEGTKCIQRKCEEIGQILSRVEKILEDGTRKTSSQKFLEEALKEKSKIESEVEAVIQKLNKKRENDEQMFMDFKEDIQQQSQCAMLKIEKSLEFSTKQRMMLVEEKIKELRKALVNLQHLSKVSQI